MNIRRTVRRRPYLPPFANFSKGLSLKPRGALASSSFSFKSLLLFEAAAAVALGVLAL